VADPTRVGAELDDAQTVIMGVVRLLAVTDSQFREAKVQVRSALDRVRSASGIPTERPRKDLDR